LLPHPLLRPAALGLLLALALAVPAEAAWDPPGMDLTRPRLLFRAEDLDTLRERLPREPYRTLFERLLARAAEADGVSLGDPFIDASRFRARAAKNLAFVYALDRTLVDGEVVPFPSAAAREAVGDRVRELLLNLFPFSRIDRFLPVPVGDWDRDITTSEELLQYATAYDTLAGAGYDFGDARGAIVERLTDLASNLYLNYIRPETAKSAFGFNGSEVHQNNHRSKVGAALVAAGVALAEETPAPGEDPQGIREPARWIEYGLDQMDLVVRWVLTAGDGAYGEGLHYLNFAAQNLHPVLRAWDRLVDGTTWQARGLALPSLWRHPLFRRSQRWALDLTLPDGSLAPFDDSPVGRSYFFGTAPRPRDPALAAAFAWRWAHATEPFRAAGNVDLAADAIVNHVDDVAPAPPPGSPTAFYPEGGNAVFRSDWSEDGIVAVVLAEHDTAASFGRDRNGLGVGPQSHEHEDAGSVLLHAFGERLLLEPGFVEFDVLNALARPEAHSLVYAEDARPTALFLATILWGDRSARPRADGLGVLHAALDGDFLDAVSVATRHGLPLGNDSVHIRRRFLFPDDRYLVVADRVGATGPARSYRWLWHGNGGATSGGDFTPTPIGGRWSRAAARLDAAVDVAEVEPVLETGVSDHEVPGGERREHVVLRTHASGTDLHALTLLYPTRTDAAPPRVRRLGWAGTAALALEDEAGDRRVAVAHRAGSGTPLRLSAEVTGLAEVETDGRLLLVDETAAGAIRLAWAEAATHLSREGRDLLRVATPGRLGLRPGPRRAELVVDNADAVVELPPLSFEPRVADGACALHRFGDRSFVELGHERRVVLRPGPRRRGPFRGRGHRIPPLWGGKHPVWEVSPIWGDPPAWGRRLRRWLRRAAPNARPAADPGPTQRVAVGAHVTLDASASCDADGDALRARWTLEAAPPGSDWILEDADGFHPVLRADRPGPFHLDLVVTDARGQASRPARLVVVAGDVCADGRDDDRDGLIDTDDPDCDSPVDASRAPVARDDLFVVPARRPFEAPTSVLANDEDPDGDALTAVVEAPPRHGSLLLLADGRFFYEPRHGFAGTDHFEYRARDAERAASAPARVTLEVQRHRGVPFRVERSRSGDRARRGPR